MASRSFLLIATLAALGLGGSVAAGEVPVAPAACPAAGVAADRVGKALDGDTLGLADGRVVRLAGIEAPKGPGGGLAEAARAALAGLAEGQAVGLAPASPDPDRHGRVHAFLFLGAATSLQSELVKAGWARVHVVPGEAACATALLADEAAARTAGRGLWASHDYAIRKADDPSLLDQIGLYELVEGRVVSVGRGSRLVFLDFGRDWRRDFTVMVDAAAAAGLAKAGMAVDSLAKRRVRVRGIIEDNNGPAMRIGEPAAIELLDAK